MKTVISLFLLLLTAPVFGQLTKEDIRTIFKEENAASEKRLKEYIDLKIDGVEKNLNAKIDGVEKSLNARIDATNAKIDGVEKSLNAKIDAVEKRIDKLDEKLSDRIRDVWHVVLGLIGLIVATVAIPQFIIAYRERGQKAMQSQIDQLREQIEAMNQSINELMHQ